MMIKHVVVAAALVFVSSQASAKVVATTEHNNKLTLELTDERCAHQPANYAAYKVKGTNIVYTACYIIDTYVSKVIVYPDSGGREFQYSYDEFSPSDIFKKLKLSK